MNYAKDGITVAPMLDTTHPKKDGTCPVRIRVTYQRQRQYYATGKSMTAEAWASLTLSKSRSIVAVRKDIENSYNVVRTTVEELANSGSFSFDNLNKRLKAGGNDTLNKMFQAKIEELKSKGQIGTMLVYDNVLKGIERFCGRQIRVEAITQSWIRKYEDFLRREDKTQTTI